MRKKRKSYSPGEKVMMLRRHLLDGAAVSDICEEHELRPSVFHRWQREFFDGGAAAFEKDSVRELKNLECKIQQMEGQLGRKNEVIAELMEEQMRCKKNSGVS